MTAEFADWTIVLGRFVLGAFFAYGGITHFLALDPITQAMADRGVPQPRLVLIAGSLFQIVFGLLLAFGIAVPVSAIALIAFTVVASLMLVDFWNSDPAISTRRGCGTPRSAIACVMGSSARKWVTPP